MGVSFLRQVTAPFGFHIQETADVYDTFRLKKNGRSEAYNPLGDAPNHNLTVILGYCPLVGTLIGIFRSIAGFHYLYLCLKGEIEDPQYVLGCAIVLRGFAEIPSDGIFLVFIDIIVSFGRWIHYNKYERPEDYIVT
jgi:hypothetical protein